jgi:hypothetical protein
MGCRTIYDAPSCGLGMGEPSRNPRVLWTSHRESAGTAVITHHSSPKRNLAQRQPPAILGNVLVSLAAKCGLRGVCGVCRMGRATVALHSPVPNDEIAEIKATTLRRTVLIYLTTFTGAFQIPTG